MSDNRQEQIGSHEPLRAKEKTQQGSERVFGFVFAAVFLIVATYPLLGGDPVRYWALVVAALVLIAALVKPGILAPANTLWTGLGLLLHKITNPIILGVIFFLVVTPTGVIMRLTGRDFLKLKFDPDANTYWINREPPGPDPEDMSRQF